MVINCKDQFNTESLNKLCEALNEGKDVQIQIDCIGHTRSEREGAHYASELYSIYGDNLTKFPDDVFYHSYKLSDSK